MRNLSRRGGVQVILDEKGSWSELADANTALPSDAFESVNSRKRGVLSFLRGKGRDRSPKPTVPGVLGKEGARHIIG